MAQYEYTSRKCILGWTGAEYIIKDRDEGEPGAEELGKRGWELVGFWPNPEPYLKASHEHLAEREKIQIAFFKRQVGLEGNMSP